jgi:hypothetical protein
LSHLFVALIVSAWGLVRGDDAVTPSVARRLTRARPWRTGRTRFVGDSALLGHRLRAATLDVVDPAATGWDARTPAEKRPDAVMVS